MCTGNWLQRACKLLPFLVAGFVYNCSALLYTPDIETQTLLEKYAASPSQFMELDGMQVHYRDEGKLNMPVVVLLHGSASSLHTWQGWADLLQADYRVVRLDLPGFGLTGPNNEHDYSAEYYSKFLQKFLSALKIQKYHLVGNSLGGWIAWNHAVINPQNLLTLTLIDSSGYPMLAPPYLFRMARLPYLSEYIVHLTPRFLVRWSLFSVFYNTDLVDDSMVERYYDLLLRTGNRDAFLDRIRTTVSLQDTPDKLATIQTRTLVLWGEHDLLIPPSHAERFRQDLPNSTLVMIQDAGHFPMEEQPGESCSAFMSFIKDADTEENAGKN